LIRDFIGKGNFMKGLICCIGFILVLLSSCAAPPPISLPTASSTDTQKPSPVPTIKPTKTEVPTPTPIPGFEDWSVVNPQSVDIQVEKNSSLLLTLKRHALWFMQQRGVLLYKPVGGNFKITADVYTAKSSDPSQPPGGDKTVQLGGLMARNGNSGQENYVFIVVGDDGNGLSVETKNTTQGLSKYEGPYWGSGEAELRLCRVGQTFNLYKRHVNANEPWTLATSYDRPDLPDTLQVGVNIYTDSSPDLQIRFENMKVQPVSSIAECETD
jgi:hypothetical protein